MDHFDNLEKHICKCVENVADRFYNGFTDVTKSIRGLQAKYTCLIERISRKSEGLWLLVKELTTWFINRNTHKYI